MAGPTFMKGEGVSEQDHSLLDPGTLEPQNLTLRASMRPEYRGAKPPSGFDRWSKNHCAHNFYCLGINFAITHTHQLHNCNCQGIHLCNACASLVSVCLASLLYPQRQLHNNYARGIYIELHAHQLHNDNCFRRQNPGAFLGTTKETNTPFWHLLDPRLSDCRWLKVASSGLKWLKVV